MSTPNTNSWLDKPILSGTKLTWEQGLYILILLLCLASRLWMLGDRAQSHDESLHSLGSWNLVNGRGYSYDPAYHGPFLYHVTGLTMLLLGDSDFASRLPVALMGVLLVAFPYLLRRYLGRSGALVTSLLLLISPSISYYSRYIRMDVPVVLEALVVVWAALRYLDEGRERYLYILVAAFSIMYTTMEVAPIFTMFIAVFLLGIWVKQALTQPWERQSAERVFVGALGVAALGLIALVIGRALAQGGRNAPIVTQLGAGIAVLGLVAAVGAFLYGLWDRLRSFRVFDLIVVIGTLSLPFASPLPILLATKIGAFVVGRYPLTAAVPAFWSNLANLNMLVYQPPQTYYSVPILLLTIAAAAAIGMAWNWRRWLIVATIYTFTYLLLFTTIFNNKFGLASGWIGGVGYWLSQQTVARGSQPWYYYLVILPIYDFLPLLGALAGMVYLAVSVGIARGRAVTQSLLIPFSLLWTLLAWVAYSVAGEKMPWLTVHIVVPMILLTGWLVGRLLDHVDGFKLWKRQGWLLLLILPALAGALGGWIQAWEGRPFQGMELDALLTTGTFVAGLVGLVFLGILVALLWRRVGARQVLLMAGLAAFLIVSLLTVHVAYRLSFINYDRPAEFLVYAHGGSDIRTLMEQLDALSIRVKGAPHQIDVTYGPDGSWPLAWYFRESNYPNARFYTAQPTRDQVLATAVVAGSDQWAAVEPLLGDDYYTFDKVYMWWPVEDYKQLDLTKVRDWLTDTRKRTALWRIFYSMDYRLYNEVNGSDIRMDNWPLRKEFRLYIRKDVGNQLWGLDAGQSPPPPAEAEPGDPFAAAQQSLAARQTWGTSGSATGQFSSPHGIAISPDGFVYVADSGNNRIEKFTADGRFVTAWGTAGNCDTQQAPPGAFCDPWGVAVGPDGSVYVADTWAHRIQKFTADGEFVTQWGSFGQYGVDDPAGGGFFYGPRNVVIGPDGSVYVSDTGNKRVQVFDANGAFLRQWGGVGTAPGQLDEPVGLAVGPGSLIYVADTWNRRIQALSPDGTPRREWPVTAWESQDAESKPFLAADADGQIYATDPDHYRVLVFDAEGNALYSFGQAGSDNASFGRPSGLAVGADGLLYVTDAANSRVMVFEVGE